MQNQIDFERIEWVKWMFPPSRWPPERISALWRKRYGCCWPQDDKESLPSSASLQSMYFKMTAREKIYSWLQVSWLWNAFCYIRKKKKRPLLHEQLWTMWMLFYFHLQHFLLRVCFSLTLNSWQPSHFSLSIYQIRMLETVPGRVNCDAQRPTKGSCCCT